ncbi:hypothetical protein LMH87_006747 [Akanthomyces muscarius]|uniref:Uncharacterized protein n=1 Tax=Akanthomyces muscarius TaxID=2231603 RepID=A0A9W8UT44_AKAMU|nr:hypothetical protein LMH87_006747 [Akanthomyces muscarius]KAJ4165100.1 hypothetical protein LMH87_006747 [Akanthomyces muscarius]
MGSADYISADGAYDLAQAWPALTKSWSLDSSWINNGGTCCGCVSGNDLGASVAATDKDVCAEQGGLVELVTEELSGLMDTNPACVSEKAPNEHAVEMFSKLGASYIARVDEQSSNFIGLHTNKQGVRQDTRSVSAALACTRKTFYPLSSAPKRIPRVELVGLGHNRESL